MPSPCDLCPASGGPLSPMAAGKGCCLLTPRPTPLFVGQRCRGKVPQIRTEMYFLAILEARSPRQRCRQDWFLLMSLFWHLYCLWVLISSSFFFFFNKFIYFYFWLRWVFVAAHRLSLIAASGNYSWLRCVGISLLWLLLLRSTGSRHTGFRSCGTRA